MDLVVSKAIVVRSPVRFYLILDCVSLSGWNNAHVNHSLSVYLRLCFVGW